MDVKHLFTVERKNNTFRFDVETYFIDVSFLSNEVVRMKLYGTEQFIDQTNCKITDSLVFLALAIFLRLL